LQKKVDEGFEQIIQFHNNGNIVVLNIDKKTKEEVLNEAYQLIVEKFKA
jgi:hypothetical protein